MPDELEVVEPSRAGHLQRVTAFDGLRGLAALVVVFHHSLLASSSSLAAQYESSSNRATTGSLTWWLTRTPLHIFWAGQEAVLVFFVLSGYVLALPAVKKGARWFDSSYYPRRFIRLYLPVWGALVFAAIVHLIHSRKPVAGATFWLNGHPNALSAMDGLKTATLVRQAGVEEYTSVLWSLKYEVLFSLFLPLLLLLPIVTRRRPWLALLAGVLCLGLIGVGAQRELYLQYMPVFVLGSLLAFHMDKIRLTLAGRMRAVISSGAVVLAVCLLTMSYWQENSAVSGASAVPMIGVVLGACLAMWISVNSPTTRRLFESRPGQWLGSRSFSLYLVHEPIVVTMAFVWGGKPQVAEFLLVVVPLSLIAAELFWRAVERPSTRLARWVGDETFTLFGGDERNRARDR